MKINEVEALVNITKKNIRFYEEQGLLSPQRNAENGYSGVHTLSDGMRRHLISLERTGEKWNYF